MNGRFTFPQLTDGTHSAVKCNSPLLLKKWDRFVGKNRRRSFRRRGDSSRTYRHRGRNCSRFPHKGRDKKKHPRRGTIRTLFVFFSPFTEFTRKPVTLLSVTIDMVSFWFKYNSEMKLPIVVTMITNMFLNNIFLMSPSIYNDLKNYVITSVLKFDVSFISV